jgi:hypothetical protein
VKNAMVKASAKQMEAFRKLGYSDAQIEEMLEDDLAVDRGETLPWDLSKEEHKKAMKNANADEHKKPTVFKFDKRERKENAPKRTIIDEIYAFLTENAQFQPENVQILNKERQISFDFADEKFEITLTQKRKAKNGA